MPQQQRQTQAQAQTQKQRQEQVQVQEQKHEEEKIQQQQQQQQQQQSSIPRRTLLQALPNLPERLAYPQCVFFSLDSNPKNTKEIIICGGYYNTACYSYHLEKMRYKFIASYPRGLRLFGHTVIAYCSNDWTKTSRWRHRITLLSFGGQKDSRYHTLRMNYQSVWSDEDDHYYRPYHYHQYHRHQQQQQQQHHHQHQHQHHPNSNSYNNENKDNDENIKKERKKHMNEKLEENEWHCLYPNQWMSLPDHIKFGKYEQHNLRGARALIGGSDRHLLFITRHPDDMDVIDLRSFQYLKDLKYSKIPISKNNRLGYHCFVSIHETEFILMSKGETLLIRYNEIRQEFTYQMLSNYSPLYGYSHYTYAFLNQNIFIFGGYDRKKSKKMNAIWKFNKKKKIWKECDFRMPFSIDGSIAAVSDFDSSIHILGGADSNGKRKSSHFIMRIWMTQKVETLTQHWIRENNLQMGWISEFNEIIANYINP